MCSRPANGSQTAQTPVFASYGEFYSRVYSGALLEQHTNPAGGTVFVSAQNAGDWSDARIPELAIGSIISGSGTYYADLGAGRFHSRIMPQETLVVAPNSGSEILRDASHTVLVLTIPYAKLISLSRDDCRLPENGDFGALHARPIGDPLFALLLRRVWEVLRAPTPQDLLFHEGILLVLAGTLARSRPSKGPRAGVGGRAPWQLKRARNVIEAHLAENLSLKVIAAEIGLSPFHFARAFRASTGMPPHRFLLRCRIERACSLLETTHQSITDIACAVGFPDASYFARMFRRLIGVTPKDYRQMKQRVHVIGS